MINVNHINIEDYIDADEFYDHMLDDVLEELSEYEGFQFSNIDLYKPVVEIYKNKKQYIDEKINDAESLIREMMNEIEKSDEIIRQSVKEDFEEGEIGEEYDSYEEFEYTHEWEATLDIHNNIFWNDFTEAYGNILQYIEVNDEYELERKLKEIKDDLDMIREKIYEFLNTIRKPLLQVVFDAE